MSVKELKKLKKELMNLDDSKKYYLVKDFDNLNDIEEVTSYEIYESIQTKSILDMTYNAFKGALCKRVKNNIEFDNISFFSTNGLVINYDYFNKLKNSSNKEFTLMDISKKDILSPLVYVKLYSTSSVYVPEVEGLINYNKYAKSLLDNGFTCYKDFDSILDNFKKDTYDSSFEISAKKLTLK